jgi:transglutaminase/protease-like cytokinesis protein 3
MTLFINYFVSVVLNFTMLVLPVNALSVNRTTNMPLQSISLAGDSAATVINRNSYSKGKSIPGRNLSTDIYSPASRFSLLDEFSRNAPLKWEMSIQMLADSLIKPARNQVEKARVLFTWVVTHVHYDMNAYEDDNYRENSPGATLRRKMGLCGDISCLFSELCQAAGLEAFRISGLSKGFRFRIMKDVQPAHHAWNVIRIDSRWSLMDVTWASSVTKKAGDSVISVPRFEPFWFDVDPEAFIFTHFPDSDKWQLLGKDMISYDRFLTLPFLSHEFFKAQFNCNSVFLSAVKHHETDFVQVYHQMNPIKVRSAPVNKYLTKHKRVSIIIESDYAESIVLMDDRERHDFKKVNNVFSLDCAPGGHSVWVTVKDKNADTYKRLLEYETKP